MSHSHGLFSYTLLHQDTTSAARRGTFRTTRGEIQLPAFMPVGTLGTVKGVTVPQLKDTGAEIILGNTYHLSLRPGEDVVQKLGGLHRFSGWQGPILTDSGGFQIFSLAKMAKIDEHGAVFRSHINGDKKLLTPEISVAIQESLGSDIAMVLDHVVGLPNTPEILEAAMERSIRWAARCQAVAQRDDQTLFAIVQGGLIPALRRRCAESLAAMNFRGYAIGGLSVGETPEEMVDAIAATMEYLPPDKPRYLMGVGRPEDILNGVRLGVDMFDCVMPTRNGRNAMAFTDSGPVRLRNKCHETDDSPLEVGCSCPACRLHSRGYLRHLFVSGEMLGPILLTIHNLTYYQRLMAGVRTAIVADRFMDFYRQKFDGWLPVSDL